MQSKSWDLAHARVLPVVRWGPIISHREWMISKRGEYCILLVSYSSMAWVCELVTFIFVFVFVWFFFAWMSFFIWQAPYLLSGVAAVDHPPPSSTSLYLLYCLSRSQFLSKKWKKKKENRLDVLVVEEFRHLVRFEILNGLKGLKKLFC